MKCAAWGDTGGRSQTLIVSPKQEAREWATQWQRLNLLASATWSNTVTVTSTAPNFASFSGPTVVDFTVTSNGLVPTAVTDSTTSVMNPLPAVPLPRRQPAPLAFSPYINATELVLEFMAEARRLVPGLTRERFLKLTIADFFAFLIRRAAETDGVPPPEGAMGDLPELLRRDRCSWCGRFLPRRFERLRLAHCNIPCLERAAARDGVALARG